MSARLESLLDAERLAELARNDALMGIAPPPVELDEEFFRRVDLSMPSAEERERRAVHRALEMQQQRWGASI